MSRLCPDLIPTVDYLQAGHPAAVGSVISWIYTIDGEKEAKEIVEAIDEEKKSITYKVIEGDLMESFNMFKTIIDVQANNGEDNLVTWTLEYEKKRYNVPEPHEHMDFALSLSKQIELLLVPN